MALTNTEAQKAKPAEKPWKLADRNGLYLLVQPTGSKLWRWKYRYKGKEKLMALGTFPLVSLAQARDALDDGRRLLEQDMDPMAERKQSKDQQRRADEGSFDAVARLWWQSWKPARNERHAAYVLRRMEMDVFPAIGAKPIGEINAPDLVAMLKPIADRGALDIAKRALENCGQVFRYAIAHGLAQRNPATDIKPADVLPSRQKANYSRLDAKELPLLLRHIEVYQGSAVTRMAMKLIALTFVRTSELIGARWCEFDLPAARWSIPAERMKMKTPHIVPLATQAIELLQALHTLTGTGELLFPGERRASQPMSNNTILKALERMGYKGRMTGHGFRGIASTALHEHDFQHAHIELQLAHQERNQVSASYNHALYLRQRAEMMQWWADYLDHSRAGAQVIPLRTG